MGVHWSIKQLDLLHTHWADPEMALAEIAGIINTETGSDFSRSAIGGKAKRLGLPLRRKSNKAGPRVLRKPSPRVVASKVVRTYRRVRLPPTPIELAKPVGEPPHLGLTLLQTNDETCKFPRGEENFTFCGQPTLEGQPYCVFHARLCYAPPVTRENRRAA